jgi:hypothetical protein
MFKVSWNAPHMGVREYEVLKLTEHLITTSAGTEKHSNGRQQYYGTFQEAKSALVHRYEKAIEGIERSLVYEKEMLERARQLTPLSGRMDVSDEDFR